MKLFWRNKIWQNKTARGFFVLLLLAELVWRFEAAATTRSEQSVPTLGVTTIKKMDLVQKVTISGTLTPNKKTVLSAPYNGYISKIFVSVGQQIKAGEPVVTVVQSLHGPSSDSYPMRAPFTGTVVQVLKTEGEYVEPGKDTSPMVRIDDNSKLFVVADVPESDVQKIVLGQPAEIKTSALQSKTYHGVIREIAMAAKDKSQGSRWGEHVDFTIKIEITDKDQDVRSGMSTLVDVITAKRQNVFVLPHEYVQHLNEKYFVTLQNGTKKDVQIGLQNEEVAEILSGLGETDAVKVIDFSSLSDDPK